MLLQLTPTKRKMKIGVFSFPAVNKSALFTLLYISILTTVVRAQTDEDVEKSFTEKMEADYGQTMPVIIKQVTHSFLKTPYVAGTLEGNQQEQLVYRFDGLDCTTLVENVLALALTYTAGGSFEQFKEELTKIRYRNGEINGYPSRLHYFTDWLYENEKRGVIRDITQELGGIPLNKKINFMTSHPDLYPSAKSEDTWKQLKIREDSINARLYYYIPLADIKHIEPKLNDGDIIGIASNINGLDCNHMGIVNKVGSQAYLLHASSLNKKVELSAVPLHQYVAQNKKNSGIFVARPVE